MKWNAICWNGVEKKELGGIEVDSNYMEWNETQWKELDLHETDWNATE